MNNAETRFRELETESTEAFLLARLVSFAVRADPALIRRARLELTDLDVGSEADLWFSPAVDVRTVEGIVLNSDVAELLRRHLAASDQDLYDRAWALTRSAHAHLSPAIQLEEEVSYLIHSRRGDSEARAREGFLSAVAAMVADEGGDGLAHWAARAIPRFPASARNFKEARMLSAGANLRLDDAFGERPTIDADRDWISLVTPRQVQRLEVGVRLWPDLLEVVDAQEAPHDQRMALPKTDPLVLEAGIVNREYSNPAAKELEKHLEYLSEQVAWAGQREIRSACGALIEALQHSGQPEVTHAEIEYRSLKFRAGDTARLRLDGELMRLRTVLGDEFSVASSDLPLSTLRRVLESLRDHLHLEALREVLAGFVESSLAPTFARRLFAQVLIDLGELSRGMHLLMALLSDTVGSERDQANVRDVMARAFTITYLNAGDRGDVARAALERAVTLHIDLRAEAAEAAERGRHAVLATGLLRRAEREGWKLDGYPGYQNLAKETIDELGGTKGPPPLRNVITLVDAYMAIDEPGEAQRFAHLLAEFAPYRETSQASDRETSQAALEDPLTPYDLVNLIHRIRVFWEAT